jgi:hypothetical protein
MTVRTLPVSIDQTLVAPISLTDIVTAYGTEAVIARIATLHSSGRRSAARAIERELNQLNLLRSDTRARTGE